VKAEDVVKIWDHPLAKPADEGDVRIVHLDEHLVVVQKPAGVTTLRHREETDLPIRRKQLQPTFDELVLRVLAERLGIAADENRRGARGAERHSGRSLQRGSKRRRNEIKRDPRLNLRPVHRLDRDTSGLMLFARTPAAEQALVKLFARHDVQRAYVAVALGLVAAQTVESWLVRDRGDGLRGSSPLGAQAENARRAVTHFRPLEQFTSRSGETYTIVECRLETGRTHQIRIHLAEQGHVLCGEKTYTHPQGSPPISDASRAPRQALHAAELAFVHPITGQGLRFRMPLPKDLKEWLLKLRPQKPGSQRDEREA
jgi:23S rRNA pseudouridine1911/1915/1917 synthase